ncbi:MAG: hypothetical protein LBT12_01510 [Oscillospiraceae bacterium]|jgi:hypothetical protein|nr:hypothetical protein [Oscillospiraceae bacterium]
MTQLIINNTAYPETSKDKYKCYTRDVGENLRMISGRLVTEISYKIVVLEYSYDYFKPELMRQCAADLRIGNEVTVAYLAPESDEMIAANFKCVKPPAPVYAFSKEGKPYWHTINFTLEGVEGID